MKLKSGLIKQTAESRLYKLACPIIGLTGGIATGKSTVSALLKERGFSIICADELVKTVYQSDKTISYLKMHIPQVLSPTSEIDFALLRKLFFADVHIKENIEELIYSQLPQAFKNAFEKFEKPDLIIYDVPLLFEKGLDDFVDLTAVAYCSKQEQVNRLIKRDSIDNELALKIISNQFDIEKKKELADIVIDNQSESGPIMAPFLNCFE